MGFSHGGPHPTGATLARWQRRGLRAWWRGVALAAVMVTLPVLPWTDGAQAQEGGAPPAPAVTVARPVVRDVVEWSSFIGRFEAVDSVDLRARVTGYLDSVRVPDGAVVRQGDVLFTIDSRTYDTALRQAEADLASAVAKRDFAVADLARADELRRTNTIATQVADQRRQVLQSARAEVDGAQAALARARLDMGFTEVRAPISGRLSRRLVSPGALINANETVLANIVSTDPIQFYFDVDERAYLAALAGRTGEARAGAVRVAGRDEAGGGAPGGAGPAVSPPAVSPGAAAEDGDRPKVFVTLTDTAVEREGVLDFLDNRLDGNSGTLRGRALLRNRDQALLPGMFGRVRLPSGPEHRAVLIPDEALSSDQDRRIVYVVGEGNKVAARPVRTGPLVDGYRVVRDGLSGGETIAINGLARVRPGAVVAPRLVELPPRRGEDAPQRSAAR
ncbi:efflux RND transporter periplasmic adaptor subunit [Roseomonas elaeocarpi]|uniref:Efflux RND transporter periplasmic adaptor subunit n=1 Tax=Roseomonas elaeocarpi TaxID=907779 RepID=A0ABV6JW92_9PROT